MKTSIIIMITLGCILLSCKKEKQAAPENGEPFTFIDNRDGQKYKWVKIGTQVWMAENLNYYTPTGSWYYNNDSISYAETYGRFYIWNTMMNGQGQSNAIPSGVQGTCPNGWHIPSDAEWQVLVNYLSTNNLNADDLKERGILHWKLGYEGTNSTGFTALPSGGMNGAGSWDMGSVAYFHSSTKSAFASAWILQDDIEFLLRGDVGPDVAACVRCLRNN
jgi:uncharacterized protein (TIGR02145 family)